MKSIRLNRTADTICFVNTACVYIPSTNAWHQGLSKVNLAQGYIKDVGPSITCIIDLYNGLGPEGHLREVWLGVCRRGLQTLTLLKKNPLISLPCLRQETFFRDQKEIIFRKCFL